MWSPLSKILELVGAVRLPALRMKNRMIVGNAKATDAIGTNEWRLYLNSRELSRVWGPHPQGPWTPFHCITLFVALDYLKHEAVGPCDADLWPARSFRAPSWIDAQTMLLVDLPGPQSVALGAALGIHGCDLVCTFNNWPNPKGVIRPENTLAALLRYASVLDKKRSAFPTPAPVAWLCDAERLGKSSGKPGQFDNRYYIEDAIMPGPNYLRERGISKVIYISSEPNRRIADLAVHLHAYGKDGLLVGQAVATPEGELLAPQKLDLSTRRFVTKGFFRSTAGGFGAPVPHPSSSGSGG
jgi:hypothetical protein